MYCNIPKRRAPPASSTLRASNLAYLQQWRLQHLQKSCLGKEPNFQSGCLWNPRRVKDPNPTQKTTITPTCAARNAAPASAKMSCCFAIHAIVGFTYFASGPLSLRCRRALGYALLAPTSRKSPVCLWALLCYPFSISFIIDMGLVFLWIANFVYS